MYQEVPLPVFHMFSYDKLFSRVLSYQPKGLPLEFLVKQIYYYQAPLSCLSKNILIFPLFLKDSVARDRILGLHFILFQHFSMAFSCLLASMISDEKSAVNFTEEGLYFTLAAFKILSLSF